MTPSDTLTAEEKEALADTQETTPQDGWRKSAWLDVTIMLIPCCLRWTYRLLPDDSWEIADIALMVEDDADNIWPFVDCHAAVEKQVHGAIQHHMEARAAGRV